MTINLRRLVEGLVLVAIAAFPLFSIGEVFALLAGLVDSQLFSYTPIYLKALKDVLLVVTGVVAVIGIFRSGRTNALAIPFVVLVIYIAAVSLPAATLDVQLPLMGLRWITPLFLAFLLIPYATESLLRRVASVLAVLLLAHLGMQIVQLFVMSPWFGTVAFGLAARVPGLFFIPSTAAFFALAVLYFALFHLPNGRMRSAMLVLAPVSIVLTQSGTGMVILLLLGALVLAGPRLSLILSPLLPAAIVVLLAILPMVMGRGENYLLESGGGRLEATQKIVAQSEWLPGAFGYATNSAVSLAENLGSLSAVGIEPQIVDSMYGSVLGNLGWIGTIFVMLFACYWGVLLVRNQRLDLYAFTLIFTLFGATVVVTEAFPMSLLLALLLASHLKTFCLRATPVVQPAGISSPA